MKHTKVSVVGMGVLFAALSLHAVDGAQGKKIIDTKCVACHSGSMDTKLSRISDQRKTPEGWFMTLQRMKRHGLDISADEQRDVIKYLSDQQGLAPSEIKPYRYALDQTPNVQEKDVKEKLGEMCVRCHSEARIGLQRRTADEWNKLVHFHVGQFTSLEIQYLSRDRDWFGIAAKETSPYLGKLFPKETREWNEWKKVSPNMSVIGSWSVIGHTAGKGDYTAMLKLSKNSDESFALDMDGNYADGETFHSSGTAILYGGSEYRASLSFGKTVMQQVLHYDPKTNTMSGRMYPLDHPEMGSTMNALKLSETTTILGVYPRALKMGESTQIKIVGSKLTGEIVMPKTVKLNKIVLRTDNEIVLDVTPANSSMASIESIRIGKTSSKIYLYNRVAKIAITPDYGVARVGGGRLEKQLAVFEAKGYAKTSKGLIDIGVLNNVKWSLDNFDEQAIEDKDLDFVGNIDPKTGVFIPAEAGPNYKRKHATNNAGRMSVIGTYSEGKKKLTAKAELVVTVQKFINPPIQ